MNILLVDDEILIRNWLKIMIEQVKEYNTKVFSVSSAEEALECCAQNKIDLVITDISMPHQTGLELIKMLNTTYPEIKTAVLSAYDDYEYIRKALQLGTLDYIIKSDMNFNDIGALLKKIELYNKSERYMADTKEFKEFKDDNNLFESYLENESIQFEEFLADCRLELKLDKINIFSIMLNSISENKMDIYRIMNICNITMSGEAIKGKTFAYNSMIFVIIYETKSSIAERRKEEQIKLLSLCDRNIKKYSNHGIVVSMHNTCKENGKYREIILNSIFMLDTNQYYFNTKKTSEVKRLPLEKFKEIKSKFSIIINSNLLKRQIEELHNELIIPYDIKNTIIYVMTLMFTNNDTTKCGISFINNSYRFIEKIKNSTSVEETMNIIDEFIDFYSSYSTENTNAISPAIQAAIEYINNNFEKKLTLESISSNIFLNRTYVCQLFKKELNVTFSEFIENVRIENAKMLLLNTNKSINEITQKVGYSDQSYFTKVFKKKIGISPNKYRIIYRE